VVFIAWTNRPGRSQELAAVLGAPSVVIYPKRLASRRLAPLRYAVSFVFTLTELARRRPRVTVVQNPPIFPAAAVWLYAWASRTEYVLDSHTSSFGEKGNQVAKAFLGIHRRLARGARGVLVANDVLRQRTEAWGAVALVVHEAPGPVRSVPPREPGAEPVALVVSVFEADEPVELVADVARELPHVRFRVTGRPERAPAALREAPPNVELTGYLDGSAYGDALSDADLIVVLTTDALSVVRAGYEAVYAQRPLVLSRSDVLADVFPFAVLADNRAEPLAAAVRDALERHAELRAVAGRALSVQDERWQRQLNGLRALVRAGAPLDEPAG
jgi:hypothetical protein